VNATVLVKPLVPGTSTNSIAVVSGVPDPLKGNNNASVKTIVQALQVGVVLSGNSVIISWPSSATGYVPQFTPSLVPASWSNITNQTPTVVGGMNVLTISQPGYYRLLGGQ